MVLVGVLDETRQVSLPVAVETLDMPAKNSSRTCEGTPGACDVVSTALKAPACGGADRGVAALAKPSTLHCRFWRLVLEEFEGR